ncbi:MAG: hypothetical protein DWQ36_13515 [Acidobacteria bacterium]|nr:MAG: hypothetical protein DWQ30_12035 [Acidobacteriota bacterium]REK06229.1 MAG: hypothetical protein DWQ36_13515 [Acidobacteriota bacterium]
MRTMILPSPTPCDLGPRGLLTALSFLLLQALSGAVPLSADTTAQSLPFSQAWTDTDLITADDDWSGVPGIVGYRGDDLTSSTGTDPRTILADGSATPEDVNEGESTPSSFSTGGLAEFELSDPVVALAGSGTADAPHLVLHLDTTGESGIWVSYRVRDLEDATGDDAISQLALHYRVGGAGSYVDVPAAYLADASTGGATQETAVCVQLPAAVDDESLVELRWMTTNAAGSDEWIGIDDIAVSTTDCSEALSIGDVEAAEGDSGDTLFEFTVTLSEPAPPGGVTFDIATEDGTATVADGDYDAVDLEAESIAEGETEYVLEVTVHGDSDPEEDETFEVVVSNFSGLRSGRGAVATAVGTILNDDALALAIHEIQGSGAASPFVDQVVEVAGAIVTVVGPQGFFMQTPSGLDDLDPETSEGIYVFTGAAPGVAVGDEVTVSGQVVEFFDFTELSNDPDVSVTSSGNPLPAPVVFDAATPSPDPGAPTCSVDRLECLEGMLVTVPAGFVNTGNLTFGSDPTAEVEVSAGGTRVRRETGVEFPGLGGAIPTWDGNPELFELDADKLGLTFGEINGGSTFSATGALAYEFGDYELWPSALSLDQATLPRIDQGSRAQVPPRPPAPAGYLTVGSLNLFRLFDDVDDPPDTNSLGEVRNDEVRTAQEWNTHRIKLARYIVDVLESPAILAVQEVESLSVLQALAAEIALLDPSVTYDAHLVEGNDIGTIDVGFLVLTSIQVVGVTQLAAEETFVYQTDPPDLTHDRPPLLLEVNLSISRGDAVEMAVMVLHNRSLSGIEQGRVQTKRLEQAQSIAQLIQDYQSAPDAAPLVVLGDLNAFEFTDGYVDAVGQMRGDFDPTQSLLSGPDLVNPDLALATLLMPPQERYSFHFEGSAQMLDHALLTEPAFARLERISYGRGNADAPRVLFGDDTTPLRSSDHDGFVLLLADGPARIFSDGFESGDNTAWTSSTP